MTNRLLITVLIVATFFSCQPAEEKCVLSPEIKIDMNFQSLEDSIPAMRTKHQLVNFFSHHPSVRDIFLNRKSYPNDSIFINYYFKRFTNPALDTLWVDVKKAFGNDQALKEKFSQAFSNIKHYYSEFKPPRIETLITGFEGDLYVSDTLIIVSLDYFLGKNGRYKPDMHEYMLRRYEKNFIVPSALLLFGIDEEFNKTNLNDHTVLGEMITYGKAYYFAKHILPCTPDSVFIGYSTKEIEGAKANQDLIWKRLVEDEALFSTSQKMKQRFISERPKTYEVGNECPGRIGTWVGWQMVNEYMKQQNKTSLPELMKVTDALKIFKGSKYRPEISQ
jgi:hypothetical protein